ILDALLQQVRAPVGTVPEQRSRVPRLRVLAEDDDADLRMRRAKLGGEPDPFVRVRGRHPDVGQNDIRRGPGDALPKGLEVAGGLEELHSLQLAEDADDALARDEAVLADDDADRRHRPHLRPWPGCGVGTRLSVVFCTVLRRTASANSPMTP